MQSSLIDFKPRMLQEGEITLNTTPPCNLYLSNLLVWYTFVNYLPLKWNKGPIITMNGRNQKEVFTVLEFYQLVEGGTQNKQLHRLNLCLLSVLLLFCQNPYQTCRNIMLFVCSEVNSLSSVQRSSSCLFTCTTSNRNSLLLEKQWIRIIS